MSTRDSTPPSPEDAALYGKDATPRLVAVHPLLDGAHPSSVRLYRRTADLSGIVAEEVPFYPFFFVSDIRLLEGLPRDRFRYQPLEGGGYYRFVVAFESWSSYWDAIRHVEGATGAADGRPQELYLIHNPAQQYLVQSGQTSFKEMAFDDLHRMQLDIETYTSAGFPNADRPADEVIIVALSDNRGWRRLLHLTPGADPTIRVPDGQSFATEADLLRGLVQIIRERDPDVLETHNGYAFDFPYLMRRCARHGVPFAIGRDGSEPRTFPSSMRFAERTIDFPALEIAGRHVIDTYFLVMSYDVFKRDLPGYGLKTVARYFGFAPEGRTYVEGDAIPQVWRTDPRRLLAYALDDAVETERLARHLSGSTFYLTQMLPMLYGQVARTGPAAKIESLFVREYLRRRHSLPRPAPGSQAVGGYTDVFYTGVASPVVYADVESLYPSIMLNYDVRPEGDALGLFQTLLRRLTDLRFEAKGAMAEAAGERRGELDARQSSYKVLINCFTPDTDVMTAGGLKRVGDLREGDLVYALDPETLTVEYKPVTRTYRQERYAGPIVRLENDVVDFAVTPNHRMLTRVAAADDAPTGYRWREASDLLEDAAPHHLPPRSALVSGDRCEAWSLLSACARLEVPCTHDAARGRLTDTSTPHRPVPDTFRMADWLQLSGWYLGSGSTGARRGGEDAGSDGCLRLDLAGRAPAERDEIRALLARMELAYREDADDVDVEAPLVARVLARDFGAEPARRRLPGWIWSMDGDALGALLRSLHPDAQGGAGRRPFVTASGRLARDVERLAVHCGSSARAARREDGSWQVTYDGPDAARPELRREHRWTEPYDGPIVCVEVADHHTLLAGRNGKLNWCGQSFYGQLGFTLALFNDFSEADRVAATGQEILRKIISLIRREGGRVIEVDTDGVLFEPPRDVRGEEAERAFVRRLSDEMPPGIRIGFDGRFRAMLSYKKKNYALLRYDGRLKFKGSSLVSRSSERFGRQFVREAVKRLIEEDIQGLHDLYLETRDRVVRHDWPQGVESFARTESIRDSVDQYLADVQAGRRTRAATYELAIARSRRTGQPVRKGDRISYYVTGAGANVTAFENARLADEWDPARPDENTAYYLKRLDEFASKFEPFFTEHDFRLVFSPEDLFGFSPEGIALQSHERSVTELEDDVPF